MTWTLNDSGARGNVIARIADRIAAAKGSALEHEHAAIDAAGALVAATLTAGPKDEGIAYHAHGQVDETGRGSLAVLRIGQTGHQLGHSSMRRPDPAIDERAMARQRDREKRAKIAPKPHAPEGRSTDHAAHIETRRDLRSTKEREGDRG